LAEAQAATRTQFSQTGAQVDVFDHEAPVSSTQVFRRRANSVSSVIAIDTAVNESSESISESPVPDFSEFGAFLTNEQLAHELVMDPNFTLKAPVKTGIEFQIQEIAMKAFADAMRDEIAQGLYAKTVFGMLGEIKNVISY
jgi:T-complex protein 11